MRKAMFHWIAASLLASLLLVGCGGGSSSVVTTGSAPSAQASTVALQRTTPMGVLVPLYGYPLISSASINTHK